MIYEDILNSSFLHLPITPAGSYKDTVSKKLTEFLDMVNSLEDGQMNIVGLNIHTTYVKNALNPFVTGLLQTLDLYFNGRPAAAYERLKRTMISDLKNFSEILKLRKYTENEACFRLRVSKENFPLTTKEMFHIPFELRGRVSTQRYSIPGFPCLYLGRTIYGCWEEMKRPNIDEFQAVKLVNVKPIRYLDLTRPVYSADLREQELYHYFMTWPLIASCSVKVSDYSHTFKPEYIIPQLLLQLIRDTENIDGIKYNSTHIDFHSSKSEGDFSNLVLPVKENRSSGFCSKLLSMFNTTESLSWQLKEGAIGGQVFIGGNDTLVNKRISQLELIKGMAYPYNYSSIGMLENFLDGMKVHPILDLNGDSK